MVHCVAHITKLCHQIENLGKKTKTQVLLSVLSLLQGLLWNILFVLFQLKLKLSIYICRIHQQKMIFHITGCYRSTCLYSQFQVFFMLQGLLGKLKIKFCISGFINEVQALHQPAADPKCQVRLRDLMMMLLLIPSDV